MACATRRCRADLYKNSVSLTFWRCSALRSASLGGRERATNSEQAANGSTITSPVGRTCRDAVLVRIAAELAIEFGRRLDRGTHDLSPSARIARIETRPRRTATPARADAELLGKTSLGGPSAMNRQLTHICGSDKYFLLSRRCSRTSPMGSADVSAEKAFVNSRRLVSIVGA